MSKPVCLNVGGRKYFTSKYTLTKESSYFSGLLSGHFVENEKEEIFIDRDGTYFEPILYFLRTGVLDLFKMDPERILIEAEFYQLETLIQVLVEEIKHHNSTVAVNPEPMFRPQGCSQVRFDGCYVNETDTKAICFMPKNFPRLNEEEEEDLPEGSEPPHRSDASEGAIYYLELDEPLTKNEHFSACNQLYVIKAATPLPSILTDHLAERRLREEFALFYATIVSKGFFHQENGFIRLDVTLKERELLGFLRSPSVLLLKREIKPTGLFSEYKFVSWESLSHQ